MTEFELNPTIVTILVLGALFFATCIWMLRWASKKGQFNNLEASAKMIFTEEEPEGVQTDYFPKTQSKKIAHTPIHSPKT